MQTAINPDTGKMAWYFQHLPRDNWDMDHVFERLIVTTAVAPSPDHIVPGHDPLVMQRYPAPRPELAGIVARLDVAPAT